MHSTSGVQPFKAQASCSAAQPSALVRVPQRPKPFERAHVQGRHDHLIVRKVTLSNGRTVVIPVHGQDGTTKWGFPMLTPKHIEEMMLPYEEPHPLMEQRYRGKSGRVLTAQMAEDFGILLRCTIPRPMMNRTEHVYMDHRCDGAKSTPEFLVQLFTEQGHLKHLIVHVSCIPNAMAKKSLPMVTTSIPIVITSSIKHTLGANWIFNPSAPNQSLFSILGVNDGRGVYFDANNAYLAQSSGNTQPGTIGITVGNSNNVTFVNVRSVVDFTGNAIVTLEESVAGGITKNLRLDDVFVSNNGPPASASTPPGAPTYVGGGGILLNDCNGVEFESVVCDANNGINLGMTGVIGFQADATCRFTNAKSAPAGAPWNRFASNVYIFSFIIPPFLADAVRGIVLNGCNCSGATGLDAALAVVNVAIQAFGVAPHAVARFINLIIDGTTQTETDPYPFFGVATGYAASIVNTDDGSTISGCIITNQSNKAVKGEENQAGQIIGMGVTVENNTVSGLSGTSRQGAFAWGIDVTGSGCTFRNNKCCNISNDLPPEEVAYSVASAGYAIAEHNGVGIQLPTSGIVLDRCEAYGVNGTGFCINGAKNVLLLNCIATQNVNEGFLIKDYDPANFPSSGIYFEGCKANGNGTAGFKEEPAGAQLFASNYISCYAQGNGNAALGANNFVGQAGLNLNNQSLVAFNTATNPGYNRNAY